MKRKKKLSGYSAKFFPFRLTSGVKRRSEINRKSFSIIMSSKLFTSTQSFTPSNVRKCHHSVIKIYGSIGCDCNMRLSCPSSSSPPHHYLLFFPFNIQKKASTAFCMHFTFFLLKFFHFPFRWVSHKKCKLLNKRVMNIQFCERIVYRNNIWAFESECKRWKIFINGSIKVKREKRRKRIWVLVGVEMRVSFCMLHAHIGYIKIWIGKRDWTAIVKVKDECWWCMKIEADEF